MALRKDSERIRASLPVLTGTGARSAPAASGRVIRGRFPKPVTSRALLRKPKEIAALAEMSAVFGVVLVAQIAIAWQLMVVLQVVKLDAMARIGNAYYTVWSRDPHLMAIGLVWPPLISLLEIPLVFWRDLATTGVAAGIVSALGSAIGSVYLLLTVRRLGVSKLISYFLLLVYVLHPMIVFSGSNGMSESFYLAALWACCFYFLRIIQDGKIGSAVQLGIAASVAFLSRYEGALLAPIVLGLMILASRRKTNPDDAADPGKKVPFEATVITFILPVAYVMALWMYIGWTIMGSPVYFLNSEYGNSAQMKQIIESGFGGANAIDIILGRILALSPLFLPVALVMGVWGVWKRQIIPVGLLAIWGSALVFQGAFLYLGQSSAEARYYITVVPAVITLAAFVLGRLPEGKTVWRLGIYAALVLGVPIAGMVGLTTPALADEDTLLDALSAGAPVQAGPYYVPDHTPLIKVLDGLQGPVLIDAFQGAPIIVKSNDPKKLIITSDRDFHDVLNHPVGKVKYVIAPKPEGLGGLDAINRRYPSISTGGEEWAEVYREFPRFTIYRVKADAHPF